MSRYLTSPSPEPMLTHHQWVSVAVTLNRFHRKFSRYQFVKCALKCTCKMNYVSPRGQWVNIDCLAVGWRPSTPISHSIYRWNMFMGSDKWGLGARVINRKPYYAAHNVFICSSLEHVHIHGIKSFYVSDRAETPLYLSFMVIMSQIHRRNKKAKE